MKGGKPVSLEINRKNIALTNLNKELWPGEGISKYHLIRYYLDVAPYILPHLQKRFLTFWKVFFPFGGAAVLGFVFTIIFLPVKQVF